VSDLTRHEWGAGYLASRPVIAAQLTDRENKPLFSRQSMKSIMTVSFRLPVAVLLLVLLSMLAGPQRVDATIAGIFCNGNGGNNMGSPADASGLTTSQINGFRASGLTTMILFQIAS
jgi:hypothetical protein